jgi:hypothetical protein
MSVTDRQQIVAELVPPGSRGERERHPGLAALERRGLLKPGIGNSPISTRSARGVEAEAVTASVLTLVECDRALIRGVATGALAPA